MQKLRFSFSKVLGVVGGGQMGTGIAIVGSAVSGLQVRVNDTTEERLFASRQFVESWCDKEIAKQRMDAV